MSTPSKIVEELLGEGHEPLQHGDIVKFKDGSPYHRDGYYRVDINNAIGAKPEKPWIENVDGGGGWYVDADELEVIVRADDDDTGSWTSEDVEAFLDDGDEDYDDVGDDDKGNTS